MKAFTNLEQSKKLADILPLESADMTYCAITDGVREKMIIKDWQVNIGLDVAIKENLFSYRNGYMVPCWSLAVLLDIIPYPTLGKHTNETWSCASWVEKVSPYFVEGCDSPINACYEMIVKLHEQKLL